MQLRIPQILLLIMALAVFASDAHGYLHTRQGRFIQRDPLGYMDGMNAHEYVRANPMINLDPSGLRISFHAPRKMDRAESGFMANLLAALNELCPCVSVVDLGWRAGAGHVLGATSNQRNKKDFCDCLSDHPGGCHLVHDLLQSTIDTRVRPYKEENGREGGDPHAPKRQQLVQWNPNYQGVNLQTGSTSTLVLAHELTHSWVDQWMHNEAQQVTPEDLSYNEVFAVRGANQVGRELAIPGLMQRLNYGPGLPVPNATGQFFQECDCDSWYGSATGTGWGNF